MSTRERIQAKPNASGGVFPTTHWTVINALKQVNHEDKELLFVEFIEHYTPAFRYHLIYGRGCTQEADLDDMIQGFLSDKFVFKNILDHVHEDKGRLRDYLRRCLDNYVYEQHRSKSSAAWDKRVSWEDLASEPAVTMVSEAVCPFDVGWAKTVMTEAIIRTKDQFFHSQRQHVWDVFDLCIVRPLFTEVQAVPYEELAVQLGLSNKAIQNRRVSALRAFGKHLTAVIAEYVGNDSKLIEAELAELSQIMRSKAFHEVHVETSK